MSSMSGNHAPAISKLRKRWRWLTPLIALAVFASLGGLVSLLTSAADAALKPRSVPQLLMDVENAKLTGLSGTIVQTSDLGLPQLPDNLGGMSGSDLTSLLTGSHTMRVWYGGPKQMRVALLSQFGESDVIRNGDSLWQWSSSTKSATRWTLPAHVAKKHPAMRMPGASITPAQAAQEALKAISPSTKVTSGGTTTVAGHRAYLLVLTPRTSQTLVSSVQIAIDGRTHIPTRVDVFAKGDSQPAFEVGFTGFDTGMPPASVFAFNPPPGTKVGHKSLAQLGSSMEQSSHAKAPADRAAMKQAMKRAMAKAESRSKTGSKLQATMGTPGAAPDVFGSGWSSVLITKAPQVQQLMSQRGGLGAVLSKLPTVSGAWGSGHLFQGTLFSVLLTNDGRVVVGAVPPSVLYAALENK